MDSFFSTTAALMSLLMRKLIENTLNDLVDFWSEYAQGNMYEGTYDILNGLALTHSNTPFKIYFQADRANRTTKIEPSLDETMSVLYGIIDSIVDSLKDVPRIETLLFQHINTEDSPICLRYLNLVTKDECLVAKCKQALKTILISNAPGPKL